MKKQWLLLALIIITNCLAFAPANAQSLCAGSAIGKENKKELIERAKALRANPKWARHFDDARMFLFLGEIKAQGAVSLLVGNHTKINRGANLKLYAQLTKKIVDSGRYVIYDADASTAPLISEIAGPLGVGISAVRKNSAGENLVVQMHNMGFRIDAFGEGVPVIAATDSLSGMGLAIHRKATQIIDTNGTWNNALDTWTQELTASGRNKGVKFGPVPILRSAADLMLDQGSASPQTRIRPTFVSRMNKDNLQFVVEYTEAIKSLEENGAVGSGIVVFASATVDPVSAAQVYGISYVAGARRVAGRSGGAGGMMWVVNAGFFDAGARSVGIPMIGRDSLKTEHVVHSEVQTATAPAPIYPVRLYGLLHDQFGVLFGPGGKGTMRELGATMVMMAPDSNIDVKVGFIDGDYYGGLTKFLLNLPLPQSFRDRIVLGVTPENVQETIIGNHGSGATDNVQIPTFDITRFQGE